MMQEELKKILIIDDDVEFDNKLAEKIKLAGMRPVITVTGQEALEYVKNNDDISFIILDFVMPEMDGAEFYQKLKKDMRRNIPTVILTNLTRVKDVEGLEVYIKTDTNLDEFVGKIRDKVGS